MRNNDRTNRLIRWIVIGFDFVVLNVLVYAFLLWHLSMVTWPDGKAPLFMLACNMALLASETQYATVIHRRLVSAGDVLKHLVQLTMVWNLAAYVLLKAADYHFPVGKILLLISTAFFLTLVMVRLIERQLVKRFRMTGRNTRMVTLVGNDPELDMLKDRLKNDATLGYQIAAQFERAEDFLKAVEQTEGDGSAGLENTEPHGSPLGDELYLCISRLERDLIRSISNVCDHRMVRFYYVPVSVESLGMSMKREYIDDIEVYTTYENPLENPVNKAVKRLFDIVMSILFLIPTALIFPIIYLIIKTQSPGPIFFRQKRTGLDGKDFMMVKFRSMHVNKDADKVQATKDDPRKYPFGNFMRKSNIDELPQFWNVLKGSMSIVGPRPHMLAHTEMYSKLIDKYMVRHFVKPGMTGWAQVTGFRGETKELWQMEGRVKRDIWYMEHWSIWLDFRIIWLTIKTIFVHDKNAY